MPAAAEFSMIKSSAETPAAPAPASPALTCNVEEGTPVPIRTFPLLSTKTLCTPPSVISRPVTKFNLVKSFVSHRRTSLNVPPLSFILIALLFAIVNSSANNKS